MEGVDKENVQKVIYEMSKGSKYFENEQRKEALTKQKIEHLRVQCAKLTDNDISHFQKARKFGVRAAMPGFIGCKLCPGLVFVPPNFERYTHYSELTREVFRRYDPNFIATSLDEAYLNITNTCIERGITGEEVAGELRAAIHQETGLTCSAGVAPNRMIAKVCSDINKPNGQFILPNDREVVLTFVSTLPIRKIGGIGKTRTAALLATTSTVLCLFASTRAAATASLSQLLAPRIDANPWASRVGRTGLLLVVVVAATLLLPLLLLLHQELLRRRCVGAAGSSTAGG
ncbi:hypothetical protein PR202_ga12708 [Eleusine coracana subsp. coracana]|uniref:UmuC domain-containing protein n=1 Tax=Eleusine coracana subsp. coracana TaxID=191504 RepID=A0AAV5CCU1_ELECO|nr:hypothetical protein PR202_ga12708 [Eleusine coracana subsp. coracana]